VGVQRDDGEWAPAIKISEDPGKVPIPGPKRLLRLYDRSDTAIVDLIGLPDEDPLGDEVLVTHHPTRAELHRIRDRSTIGRVEPLHVPVDLDAPDEPLELLRERCRSDVEHLDVGVRRLVNPHRYHVSLTERLHRFRAELIATTS
jgi:nicotinate phosphoribosyltransferase